MQSPGWANSSQPDANVSTSVVTSIKSRANWSRQLYQTETFHSTVRVRCWKSPSRPLSFSELI